MLHDALGEARAIGALSFELRIANDLAAHYIGLDRRDDAVHLLWPIFRRFNEGFGANDLIVASQLLKHMGVAVASSGDFRQPVQKKSAMKVGPVSNSNLTPFQ
jgi:predicted ATPase